MKLYNKKLRSLADLKHERALLMKDHKQSRKQLKEPLAGFKLGKKSKQADNSEEGFDWLGTITKLATSKSAIDIAMSLGGPLLGKVGRKGGNTIKKAAFEVLGGYVKWKLIEVGFNVAKSLLKNSKNKKTDKNKKGA
jgi:hypothetical protein